MVSIKKPKSAKVLQKVNKSVKVSKKEPEKKVIKDKKAKIIEAVQKPTQPNVQVELKDEKKKKIKHVMPSKYIKENIVSSCLDALQQLATHSKQKNAIFDDETTIFAELRCIKIQNTRGNIKFVLPHSTVSSTKEVCLITPDIKKGRKIDHEPTIDHWEELLRKAGVSEVKTLLPVRQLKVEYDQYELKRRLLTQHDYIMVDTRVLNHVSHLLGKMFFKKHNMLIPVRINDKDIKKDIDIGLRTTMLRVNEGETSTILVGHTGMPQDKLKENILSLIEQIKTKFPGGEANIRSISLKLPLSLSLPLYATLRPSSTISPPKMHQQKPKNYNVLEDELTTHLDSKVRVAPDGTVRLIKTEKMDTTSDNEEDSGSDSEEEIEESEKEDNK